MDRYRLQARSAQPRCERAPSPAQLIPTRPPSSAQSYRSSCESARENKRHVSCRGRGPDSRNARGRLRSCYLRRWIVRSAACETVNEAPVARPTLVASRERDACRMSRLLSMDICATRSLNRSSHRSCTASRSLHATRTSVTVTCRARRVRWTGSVSPGRSGRGGWRSTGSCRCGRRP